MTNPAANGAASGGNDRLEPTDGALASAGMNLLVGLLLTVMGLGHLYGVIVTAQMRGYAYDFRLAALLLVPLMPLQPDMAPGLSVLVAVNLIALLLAK